MVKQVYENGHIKYVGNGRVAYIEPAKVTKGYVIFFYYNGCADYEWKKGSNGVPCGCADTLQQAIRKALYYIHKD